MSINLIDVIKNHWAKTRNNLNNLERLDGAPHLAGAILADLYNIYLSGQLDIISKEILLSENNFEIVINILKLEKHDSRVNVITEEYRKLIINKVSAKTKNVTLMNTLKSCIQITTSNDVDDVIVNIIKILNNARIEGNIDFNSDMILAEPNCKDFILTLLNSESDDERDEQYIKYLNEIHRKKQLKNETSNIEQMIEEKLNIFSEKIESSIFVIFEKVRELESSNSFEEINNSISEMKDFNDEVGRVLGEISEICVKISNKNEKIEESFESMGSSNIALHNQSLDLIATKIFTPTIKKLAEFLENKISASEYELKSKLYEKVSLIREELQMMKSQIKIDIKNFISERLSNLDL